MSDELIRTDLKIIDNDDDIDVTRWEANFIDNVCYQYADRDLTEKQRQTADRIIRKYLDP